MTAADHLDATAQAARLHRVRRPVARFVLVATALCATLLGARWTGAFNPWVQIDSGCDITTSSRIRVEVETVLGRTHTIASQRVVGDAQPTGNRFC